MQAQFDFLDCAADLLSGFSFLNLRLGVQSVEILPVPLGLVPESTIPILDVTRSSIQIW